MRHRRFIPQASVACITSLAALTALPAMRASESEAVPTRLTGSSEPSVAPKPGTVRVAARVPDPGGDAPWVVRSWITRDGDQICAQLGRDVDGRLGMAAPDGRFVPLRFDSTASCSDQAFDRKQPLVRVQTFLDDPLAAEPRPLRTVIYGVAGPHARRVVLRGAGAEQRVPRSARNGFLAVYDGSVRTFDVAAEVSYRDGDTFTLDYGSSRRKADQPRRETVRLEQTVPSPRGGPAWGALVWEDARGGVCTYQGRVIAGGRVGALGDDGTFLDYPIGDHGGCGDRSQLTREQPLAYGLGFRADGLNEGRRDGRPTPGTTIFSATARSDVARVTVEGLGTPLDLRPSERGAVLAVFDGERTGRVRVTATFTDGTRRALPQFGFGASPPVDGQTRLTRIGPPTIRLTRDGVATVEVGCARGRRKCIGSLWLRSAQAFRRSPQGLRRRIALGSRLFRIGPGTERRPLRIRLTARNRRFIERRGSLRAFVIARSDAAPRPQERRVTLLAHGARGDARTARAAVASSTRISVSPSIGDRLASFTVRFPLIHAMDANMDQYQYVVRGPGGPDCSRTLTQRHAISWNPRYNERHRRRGVVAYFGPRRFDPNDRSIFHGERPRDLGVWCPGRHTGTLHFADGPRAEGRRGACSRAQVREGRCRARRRFVGRFSWVVRGVAPGALVVVPDLMGLSRHSAECLLRGRELRWRLQRDRPDFPNRHRPLRPCRKGLVDDSGVVAQAPAAGDRVPPGTVVGLTTRRRER